MLVMTLMVFGGFAGMGMVVFGHSLREYYSVPAAGSTLFQMLLGDFDLHEASPPHTANESPPLTL